MQHERQKKCTKAFTEIELVPQHYSYQPNTLNWLLVLRASDGAQKWLGWSFSNAYDVSNSVCSVANPFLAKLEDKHKKYFHEFKQRRKIKYTTAGHKQNSSRPKYVNSTAFIEAKL
jgi:hypothetical protein